MIIEDSNFDKCFFISPFHGENFNNTSALEKCYNKTLMSRQTIFFHYVLLSLFAVRYFVRIHQTDQIPLLLVFLESIIFFMIAFDCFSRFCLTFFTPSSNLSKEETTHSAPFVNILNFWSNEFKNILRFLPVGFVHLKE